MRSQIAVALFAVSLRIDSDFRSSWGSTSSEARTWAASRSSSGSPVTFSLGKTSTSFTRLVTTESREGMFHPLLYHFVGLKALGQVTDSLVQPLPELTARHHPLAPSSERKGVGE